MTLSKTATKRSLHTHRRFVRQAHGMARTFATIAAALFLPASASAQPDSNDEQIPPSTELDRAVVGNWNDAVGDLNQAVQRGDFDSRVDAYARLAALARSKPAPELLRLALQQPDATPRAKQIVIDVFAGLKRQMPQQDLRRFVGELIAETLSDKHDVATRALLLHSLVGMELLLDPKERDDPQKRGNLLTTLRSIASSATEQDHIRGTAIADLARFGDPAGREAAVDILNKHDINSPTHIFCCAIEAVAVLRDKSAVPRLIQILGQTEDERVFGVCSFALARIGGESSIAALVDAFAGPMKDDVRSSLWYRRDEIASVIRGATDGDILLALKAAAICRPPDIEQALVALLSSEDRDVRRHAARAACAYLPNEQLRQAASAIPPDDLPPELRPSARNPLSKAKRTEGQVAIPPAPERPLPKTGGESP